MSATNWRTFVLLLLEDKLIATEHLLETTLAKVVTLEKCLLFETLALSLFHFGTLGSGIDALTLDFSGLIDLENVLRGLLRMHWERFKLDRLIKALQKILNLLVLL